MIKLAAIATAVVLMMSGCTSAQDLNDACSDHDGVQNYVKGQRIVICRDGLAIHL